MTFDLEHFNRIIPDRKKVMEEGQIVPKKGMDPEYDQSLENIESAERELEQYLSDQKRKLKSMV